LPAALQRRTREAVADGSRVYLVGAIRMRIVAADGWEPEPDEVQALDPWFVPVPPLAMADAGSQRVRLAGLADAVEAEVREVFWKRDHFGAS
jgi:hypothetical protein